jgi:hypothetical protein
MKQVSLSVWAVADGAARTTRIPTKKSEAIDRDFDLVTPRPHSFEIRRERAAEL